MNLAKHDRLYLFLPLKCVVPPFRVSVEDAHFWQQLESQTAGGSGARAKEPSATPSPVLRVSLIRQIWLQAAATALFS